MDIKEAVNSDAAAEPSADARQMGRRVLAAGLSGAALSLLPWLTGRASATSSSTPNSDDRVSGSTSDTTSDSTVGSGLIATQDSTPDTIAPTTTAPPKQPTPEDLELLGFAQRLEITVVALYQKALDSNVFDQAQAETFNTIRQAHLAYAQSLSGTMGRNAPNTRIPALYAELESAFTTSAELVAKAAANVENTLVATHTEIVGELVGLQGANLVASFLVIEARHATVFHTFSGATELDVLLASDAKPISPSDYPVE